jgi:hypothetical protein
MACNCGNKRRNLGATSPEVAAFEAANRQAQANAEALIAKEAARLAAADVVPVEAESIAS